MRKLAILGYVVMGLLLGIASGYCQDKPVEEIINNVYDSTNTAIKVTTLGGSFTTFTDGDTTPDVLTGKRFKTANTGATSITDFDGGTGTLTTGKEITILFTDANTTLVHSAALHLQGGVDYTAAVGDCIELIYDGTNWYEQGRAGAGGVESDTLATVTGRGATTATASSFTGGITVDSVMAIPRGDNPTTVISGDVAWDSNNAALEGRIGTASALIPILKDKSFTIYGPDSIADRIILFHADTDVHPFGIKLINIQHTLSSDAAYPITWEEWTGDPPVFVSTIGTVSTDATDAYKQLAYTEITDSDIATGNYVVIQLPANTVTYVSGKCIYYIKEGN